MHRPASGLARALLVLLAEAGDQGVTEDRIAEIAWGARVSGSTVAVAVHRLRQWLRSVAGEAVRIDRTTSGYLLVPADATVDVTRFRELVVRAAASPPRERADLLGRAMALIRGPVLADVPAERTDPALVARLHRELRDAALDHGRALLAAGEAARAAAALEPAAERNPLDEPVHAAWIQALAVAGRRADALAAYQRIRTRLCDEFGVDPGRELARALDSALRQENRGSTTLPAQLPPDTAGFTGRAEQLAALTGALRTHHAVAVVGMAGVGKTALAVHWGHRAAARFPDGQLYVDLRGYAAGPPVRPVDVLARFLRALGVLGGEIPADLAGAAARYRYALARRRVLVVLDNALDDAQVRPLLPGAPGCRVVITGRTTFDDLVVLDGAARLSLDVLSEAEAIDLLRAALGEDRVDAEPEAVRGLARACSSLPLALRITAAHLADPAGRSIAGFASRLCSGDRLAELSVPGDPQASVRTVFDQSYRRLAEPTRRVFRQLGLLPCTELTVAEVAVLAGLDSVAAQQELDRLVAESLLFRRPGGRFFCHELLAEHARNLCRDEAPDSHRAELMAELM
jgi:DNA-binding SARP family transcriptional activator